MWNFENKYGQILTSVDLFDLCVRTHRSEVGRGPRRPTAGH